MHRSALLCGIKRDLLAKSCINILLCYSRHHILSLKNIASSGLWTLTQKSCSSLTERKGESRQTVVGVTVQRETLMCVADKTLVCRAPVRPAHPSRAAPGTWKCERDVNWTMPELCEVESERGEERASWEGGWVWGWRWTACPQWFTDLRWMRGEPRGAVH